MSFFGTELNAQINKLIFEIRLQLSRNKHSPNVRTIYRSFAKYDPDISGLILPHHFEHALNQNGLFFKKYQIQVFQKAFNSNGKINWFEFLTIVKQSMGPLRRQLVQHIFAQMDVQKQGNIPINKFLENLNTNQIQAFRYGKKSEQQVKKQFVSLFHAPQGYITRQQFISYYDDMNINFTHNDVFFRYVSSQWHYNYQKLQAVKEENVKIAIKNLRYKLIQKTQGSKDELLIRKLFNQFDRKGNFYLSTYETNQMMKSLGVEVGAQIAQTVHERIDKNNSGYIEFQQFKKFLFYDPYHY